jgi:hypothetical protein
LRFGQTVPASKFTSSQRSPQISAGRRPAPTTRARAGPRRSWQNSVRKSRLRCAQPIRLATSGPGPVCHPHHRRIIVAHPGRHRRRPGYC